MFCRADTAKFCSASPPHAPIIRISSHVIALTSYSSSPSMYVCHPPQPLSSTALNSSFQTSMALPVEAPPSTSPFVSQPHRSIRTKPQPATAHRGCGSPPQLETRARRCTWRDGLGAEAVLSQRAVFDPCISFGF
jgi:hypothetical protein